MLIDVLYFLDKELNLLTKKNDLYQHKYFRKPNYVPRPYINDTLHIVASVNSSISLSCSVDSHPKLEISWIYFKFETTTDMLRGRWTGRWNTFTNSSNGQDVVSHLTLNNLTSSDSGYYYCMTSNQIKDDNVFSFKDYSHFKMKKYCLEVLCNLF